MSGRPDLAEQYVAADEPALIGAAMGAACATIAAGDQDARIPIVAAVFRPTERPEARIAADLCPRLWRLQDDARDAGSVAVLFAEWMTHQRRFIEWAPGTDYTWRLVPFAQRVLVEWLHHRCGKCGGSGFLQVTPRGAVRTLGHNARNTKFTTCGQCGGHGQALMRPAEQAAALGLPLAIYDQANWYRHFRVARAWLLKLLRRPNRHLRRELERM